jgi:hypothetical protein
MNVTPAEAGVQFKDAWIPASAGMTDWDDDTEQNNIFEIPSNLPGGDCIMSEFAEKLIELRDRSKLSLKEICEQAGIPPSRLVELEYGVRIPTSGQIAHLENVYGVDSGALADLSRETATSEW